MKRLLILALTFLTLTLSLTGCRAGDKYNRERFYGVVRFSEECNSLVVYIPELGEVLIPESEGCCSCYDGHEENDDYTYQLKAGDYVSISFRYPKSWDDNSVKILETHPAKFDRSAHLIEALEENICFDKTDSAYVLSFPAVPATEIAEIGDTLYFVHHGGKNGIACVALYASGIITAKADGIVTVSLTIHQEEAEFLRYYNSMTVELTWEE